MYLLQLLCSWSNFVLRNTLQWNLPAKFYWQLKRAMKKREEKKHCILSKIYEYNTVCAIISVQNHEAVGSNPTCSEIWYYKTRIWYLSRHLFLFQQRNKNNTQVWTREKSCLIFSLCEEGSSFWKIGNRLICKVNKSYTKIEKKKKKKKICQKC